MALAVCLLLDDPADRAVRRLWQRLEVAGVPSMPSHTHGLHVPHLSYVSLLRSDRAAVTEALAGLPEREPVELCFDGLGTFRRSRCWLAPALAPTLGERQEAVVAAVQATGAVVHRNYVPGVWTPHLTLAPRLHLADLPTVAALVYDVLPLTATVTRVALVDTSTGARYPLRHLV